MMVHVKGEWVTVKFLPLLYFRHHTVEMIQSHGILDKSIG